MELRSSEGALQACRRGGAEAWSSGALEACCRCDEIEVWRSGDAPQACRCGDVEVLAFEQPAHRGPKW